MDNAPFDIKRLAAWILVTSGILIILVYFQAFLKPIIVSIIIWFLVRQLRDFINRTQRIGLKIPAIVVNTLSLVIVVGGFYLIMLIIVSNIENFIRNFDEYSGNINKTLIQIEEFTGYDIHNESTTFKGSTFQAALTTLAGSFSAFIGKFFLVILYVIFIMLESKLTERKLGIIFRDQQNNQAFSAVMKAIDSLFKDYVSIKIFTSFLTGLFSFFVLVFFDVQLSGLWAFLIFLLNFIPSIGSLIATIFPSIFITLQTGDLTSFLYVFLGVGFVQIIVGNIIEPRLMGNKLNLSPTMVLFSLIFWGFLWGVIGMLLSVPILAMQMIVFSQFKDTRPVAVFLSRTGDIMPLVSHEAYKSGKIDESAIIPAVNKWFRRRKKTKTE